MLEILLHCEDVRKELWLEVLFVLFSGSEHFDVLEVLERFGSILWVEILNIVVPSQSFLLIAALNSL